MIKIIKSIDGYHTDYVTSMVNELETNGYNVTSIMRIEKMVLGIFGEDITHITYEPSRETC